MNGLTRLIREIHRRSLWQVLGIYLGSSWFVLQVADHLVSKIGLPPWVYGLAFLLLLLGLPIVLATAFVQEGIPGPEEGAPPGGPERARTAAGREARPAPKGFRRLFTWRNAILGGLVAFAAWGIVAAGWLVLLRRDPEALPWPRSDTALLRAAAGESAVGRALSRGAVRAGAPTSPQIRSVPESAGGEATADTVEGVAVDVGREPAAAGQESKSPPPRSAESGKTRSGLSASSREPAAGGGAGTRPARKPDFAEYDSARAGAEAARTAAAGLLADSLAPEVFLAADSLRVAGLEAAAAGRYRDAARGMEQATATFEDARRHAVSAWKAALARQGARVSESRAAADTGQDAFRRAAATERQAADLAADGRYEAAYNALSAAGELYRAARAPSGAQSIAPARSPEPTPSAASAPRSTVEGLLSDLSAAFSAEDLQAVQRIWTSLTPEESANFGRFFRDRRDIQVTFDVDWGTMEVSSDHIDFAVRTVWEYFDEKLGRQVRQPPFRQRFEASRQGGSWTLSSP